MVGTFIDALRFVLSNFGLDSLRVLTFNTTEEAVEAVVNGSAHVLGAMVRFRSKEASALSTSHPLDQINPALLILKPPQPFWDSALLLMRIFTVPIRSSIRT